MVWYGMVWLYVSMYVKAVGSRGVIRLKRRGVRCKGLGAAHLLPRRGHEARLTTWQLRESSEGASLTQTLKV